MGSKITVCYKASVEKDLRRLNKTIAFKLIRKLERDLSRDPQCGLPLKGEFEGLFRYRVGNYRVIYAQTAQGPLVLRIGHRKDIYR